MPIYEYQCDRCDHELEAIQKLADPVLTDCPECETPSLRRKISATAFRLKGGGWYETDFKSGNRRNVAGDGAGSSGGEGKSESKSGEGKSGGEGTSSSEGNSKKKEAVD